MESVNIRISLLGIMDKFKLFLWILLVNFIFAQNSNLYINPNFCGVNSESAGNVGTILDGEGHGYLNPAGNFSDYPIISSSFYYGKWSNKYLYPQIKSAVFNYPLIINRLNVGLSYSLPQDNVLGKFTENPLKRKNVIDIYKRHEFSTTVAYHPAFCKNLNNFDFRFGTKISFYNTTSAANKEVIYGNNFGKGFYTKLGAINKFKLSPYFTIKNSLVFQTNSKVLDDYSSTRFLPGFYGAGLGFTKRYKGMKYASYSLFGEIIGPYRWNKRGVGLSLRFEHPLRREIMFGGYIFPENPYNEDENYNLNRWLTAGINLEFPGFNIAFNYMKGFDLKNNSINHIFSDEVDVRGEIVSANLAIPLKLKKKYSLGATRDPFLFRPDYKDKMVKIGAKDSITMYIDNHGKDTLQDTKIYSNIYPSHGIILNDKVEKVGDLPPHQSRRFSIAFESVENYKSEEYVLKSKCFYNQNSSTQRTADIKTITPILNANLKIKQYKKIFLFAVPGEAIIPIKIRNTGNYTAYNVVIQFPDKLVVMGILENPTRVIRKIPPGRTKTKRFKLSFKNIEDNNFSIPIKILFKEKNGYAPPAYYTNIKVVDKTEMDANLIDIDPFLHSFHNYDNFFMVLKPQSNMFNELENFEVDFKRSNYFPGDLVVGPYEGLDELYRSYNQLDNPDIFKLYGIKNSKTEILRRYFLEVEHNQESIDKLDDFNNIRLFQAKKEKNKILIGPFKDYLQIKPLYNFCNKNFDNVSVKTFLTEDVVKYETK